MEGKEPYGVCLTTTDFFEIIRIVEKKEIIGIKQGARKLRALDKGDDSVNDAGVRRGFLLGRSLSQP
jgi:hypothetical protein